MPDLSFVGVALATIIVAKASPTVKHRNDVDRFLWHQVVRC
jgi:hypothetical protein